MRDILLVVVILGGLGVTLRYPFVGVLLWAWFTCASPHRETFGFSRSLPLNLMIVVVTILSLMISKERKLPRAEPTFILLIAFLIWMTFVSFFAVYPNVSWPLWDRTWRLIALAVFVGALATNKVRIHALIWVVAASLLYYGVKGGLFTVISGGVHRVFGPENTNIADNNQLALALLMILPLVNYLRLQSNAWWLRIGLGSAVVVTTLAVLGSYSRGAYLAIVGLAMVAWWRSRNKLLYPIMVAVVAVPALYFMPQSFYDRVNSIQQGDADDSIHGRLVAWQVAYKAAIDHFPMGVGFAGAEHTGVFNQYFPGEVTHAAHSIYFEVLGDLGFVGLAIYLSIVVLLFWNCHMIIRAVRDRPQYSWARDLAGMIQLSLFVFCLGGAALSFAYYDVFIIYIGLVPALRAIVGLPAPAKKFSAEWANAPAQAEELG